MEPVVLKIALINDGKRFAKTFDFEVKKPTHIIDLKKQIALMAEKNGADEFIILDVVRDSIPGLMSDIYLTMKLEDFIHLANAYLQGRTDIFWFQTKFKHLRGKAVVREYELRNMGVFSSVKDLFENIRKNANRDFLEKYGPFDWNAFDRDTKPMKSPEGRYFLGP